MKAKLTQQYFKDKMGSLHLDISLDPVKLKCACIDLENINDVSQTISSLRRMAHQRVDALIDGATAEFIRSKIKNND